MPGKVVKVRRRERLGWAERLYLPMLFVGLDGKPLKKPELVGLINLDGATTSFVHRLGGIEAEDLVIGLRVTAELKPKSKRKGSVTDILHFKPATRKK